jgi:hypothetical protein
MLGAVAAIVWVVACSGGPQEGGWFYGQTGGGSGGGSGSSSGGAAVSCTANAGTVPVFYSCSQPGDCAAGSICVDNAGDHIYYCKALCTLSGECPVYLGDGGSAPGPGGGVPCPDVICPDGQSSGISVCEPAGSNLAPSYAGLGCCAGAGVDSGLGPDAEGD